MNKEKNNAPITDNLLSDTAAPIQKITLVNWFEKLLLEPLFDELYRGVKHAGEDSHFGYQCAVVLASNLRFIEGEEVKDMFYGMVQGWFEEPNGSYNDFVEALLQGDLDAMNEYMNQVTLSTFSYFDTGKTPSENVKPEHFYHGFVLSLIVDLSDRYAAILESKGIPSHRIRKYGFAFEGKNVLIGDRIPIQ